MTGFEERWLHWCKVFEGAEHKAIQKHFWFYVGGSAMVVALRHWSVANARDAAVGRAMTMDRCVMLLHEISDSELEVQVESVTMVDAGWHSLLRDFERQDVGPELRAVIQLFYYLGAIEFGREWLKVRKNPEAVEQLEKHTLSVYRANRREGIVHDIAPNVH